MLLFRQYTFGELYELITKQVIMTGGMESQHAETFLAFLLVDVITPIRDLTAIRHFQMGHKKVVIALQEFDPTGKCYGIGADTHFHNQGGNFAPVFEYYMSNDITDDPYCILENANKIKLKKIEFSTLLSRTMVSGGVAFVANEVQQLINSPNKQQYTVGLALDQIPRNLRQPDQSMYRETHQLGPTPKKRIQYTTKSQDCERM